MIRAGRCRIARSRTAVLAYLALLITQPALAARFYSEPVPLARPELRSAALQARKNSCGLAATAFLLTELSGQTMTEAYLREQLAERYPHSSGEPPEEGYSLGDLHWLMAQWGYATVGVRVSSAQLSAPAILLLPGSSAAHYVVLFDLGPETASIFDPAVGPSVLTRESLLSRWTLPDGRGIALAMAP